MKKTLSVLVVLVLLLALSTAALAAGTTMYAVKDGVAVYTEKDTGSTVAKTLSKGAEVQAESAGDGWYSIEGGYVQADNLSTTKPPCEHSWGEWSESKPASCTAKGERTRTCSLCGSTETGEIDMLPHTFAAAVALLMGMLSITKDLLPGSSLAAFDASLPLARFGFEWLIPAVIAFVIGIAVSKIRQSGRAA